MRFEFFEVPSIPRLAWCAAFRPRGETITVTHGSGVEVYDDWFFEGAWDGSFDGPGFVEATTCAGTGARLHEDTVEFVSPTHPFRGLVPVRTPGGRLVSNSLAFVLSRAGEIPDIRYLDYYIDLFHSFNQGFVRQPRGLLMRQCGNVYLHFYCNIIFESGGFEKRQKCAPEAPSCFEDYRDRLVAMLVRLRKNATDARRKKTYQPLVTVSRGYDSVACAALGTAAGWKDAVTLISEEADDPANDDDGTPVAECLGLSIKKFDVSAWKKLPNVPEAEFVATGWGGVMVRFAGMGDCLQNTLLVLGNVGDRT